MLLNGEKISLRPMTESEIPLFYRWATQSDATPFWYGVMYGNTIPTFEEFTENWGPYYFNDSNPEMGRCFVILLEDKSIGQINYNNIDSASGSVEIDIIIADAKNQGMGYGTDAIMTLINYLFKKMNVKVVWIAAIKKNLRAIKAYQKVGFRKISPPKTIKNDPYWGGKNLDEWMFFSLDNLTHKN